ncbi:MAG: DUF6438 domain-containing protein [Pseudomonadota bacterium]
MIVLAACLLACAPAQDPPGDVVMWVQRGGIEAHRVPAETSPPAWSPFDRVELEVTVDKAGAVTEALPSQVYDHQPVGIRDVKRFATAAAMVRGWRLMPFVRDGKPVAARGIVTVQLHPAERMPVTRVPFPEVRREAVTIRLERDGLCFGLCDRYSVTIAGDGSVRFAGDGRVLVDGERLYAIPVARVDALIAQFRAGDFWSLDADYDAPISDSPTFTLTFSAGGRSKTVADHVGQLVGMPDIVRTLERAVDQAAETDRWVRGDAGTLAALDAARFDFRSPAAAEMLGQAMETGPDDVVIGLLDRGAPLDGPARCSGCPGGDSFLGQLLYEAVQAGRVAVFDRLDRDAAFAGLDQETRDQLLMVAAGTGKLHLVQRLLARGANPAATDAHLGSALIQALSNRYGPTPPDAGQAAVVQLLLDRGAPIAARDHIGWTALQHAYDEDPRFVRLLLARGANIDDGIAAGTKPILYITDDEEIALIALVAGASRGGDDGYGNKLPAIARRKRWTRVERLLAGPAAR